jgi:ribosome-associated protein
MIRVTDTIALDDREVEERFVRSGGSADQNARKEATAVELRFSLGASTLPPDMKERVKALAGRAVTTDGVVVVVSRALRSQPQNREAARARLIALLQRAAKPPRRRRPTTPRRVVLEERLASKKLQSALKRSRSRDQQERD